MLNMTNILAGVGLALLLKLLCSAKAKFGGGQGLTTEDYLAKMARIKNCSVYDLFHKAAREWRVTRSKVEVDFKNYLLSQDIPYYVKDLVRKNKTELDESPDLPLLMCRMY